ncbi:hypothetical protein JXR74_00380 [Candidatus Mcinerneyibacteriota bacterium]|nr:hypothetical protein [Candidatus Mcinerneyibacteriota bacterium]
MKKVLILILALLMGVLTMNAHPAQVVQMTYNAEMKVLSLDVIHPTNDPAGHFIQQVTLTLNGEEWVIQRFRAQTDKQGLRLNYYIPGLKKGDEIKATVKCNKFGNKGGRLIIGQ